MTTTSPLFDPSDPVLRRDPYAAYRRLRAQAPAWRSAEGVWYFARYEDCFEVMRHPALSYDSTATRIYQASLSDDPVQRERQLTQTAQNRSLLDVDGAEHTRLRSLITRAFTPRSIESSRPLVDEFVEALLDEFPASGSVDLVQAFGSMLPILIICRMMGVAPEARFEFIDIGAALARSMDPDVPLADKLAANRRLREYITGLLHQRRAEPGGDDLMTRLIESARDGRITEDELVINTGVLLIAGFETTTNLITNAVHQLLEFPEQRERFLRDPETDRTAIEEVLRFDPPVQFMRPRTITASARIGGVDLAPGDPVVALIGSANRDDEQFPDAETFDVTRSRNRHLSFGVGHHLCVGANLARMEARVAVRRIFERFPALRVDPERPAQYGPNLQLRGFATLPVLVA
jgi:cytochrome P450